MAKVFITGREGFIGKHLCEHLLNTRNFVIANKNGDRPDITDINKIDLNKNKGNSTFSC